jgi:hypothetical protein
LAVAAEHRVKPKKPKKHIEKIIRKQAGFPLKK